ncbi:hydroxylysine kinase [Dunckerocampus dactyliophorus]|uniref:hydroxylysine kinase n=1 Tax=Dunckerocampus dactyliophorus TaxID=161453 RepID=UPI002407737B|nr:hydroxylysine kinase [Dunckerocampus dactyliophorus]XP_054645684.1 hydroxylysine kinase [Dunckerocampus dactyliophorus]
MSEQHAKPNVSPSQAAELVKKHYNLTPSETSYLPSYVDQNFYVATVEGGQYVLKIMNSEDSKDPTLFELQTYAMAFLKENGVPTQTALKTTTGQVMFQEDMDCGYGLQKYLVRLLTYLPGIPIAKVPFSPQLLYEVGQTAAKIDNILREMKHPRLSVLQREDFIWDLSNIVLLERYMHVLDGDPLQEAVKSVLHQYKTFVAPKYSSFRKCLIHGDFNDLNVLVQANETDGHRISGIIDFGDMHISYYVHELAITIMYMMLEQADPIEVGGPILAGWESVFPLNEEEKVCLFWLVLSRFCQSLVLARFSVTLHPENEEYLMISSRKGIPILCQLLEMGKEQVESVWFHAAAHFKFKGGE